MVSNSLRSIVSELSQGRLLGKRLASGPTKNLKKKAQVFLTKPANNFVSGSYRGSLREKQEEQQIPQARVVEANLHSLKYKNWKVHFSSKLAGEGL